MPIDVFECHWKCHKCEQVNKGRDEKCCNCTNVKSDRDDEIMAQDLGPGQGIKDPELLKKFTAGPDWTCKYCGSHERNPKGSCSNCMASKSEGTSRATKKAIRGMVEAASPFSPFVPLETKTEEPVVEEPLRNDGHYRKAPTREKPDVWPPKVIDRSRGVKAEATIDEDVRRFWRGDRIREIARPFILIFIAFMIGFVAYMVLRTRTYDATIARMHWEHTVVIDRYSIYTGEGFSERKPDTAFDVQDQGTRHHHYEKVFDHYEPNRHSRQVSDGQDCRTTQNCYTTSRTCSSNKNGSMTCSGGDRVCFPSTTCTPKYRTEYYTTQDPVYRDEPRYHTWYSWKNWEWHEHRRVKEAGESFETFWPAEEKVGLNQGLGEGEQERSKQESSYLIVFEAEHKSFDYKPPTLGEFEKFRISNKRTIEVSPLTGVKVVQR